ncbi:hypothetical protein FQZ97_933550 [compost metagenome]
MAACLRDGPVRRQEAQECRDPDLEVRGRTADGRRLQGRLREERRNNRKGDDPAVPQRGVPGFPDGNRVHQAGRGLCLFRRCRRCKIRQGLCGCGPQQVHSALCAGLPDGRNARSDGRRRPGPADHAALRGRHQQPEKCGFPSWLCQSLQGRAGCLCRAGLRRRPIARHWHRCRERRHSQACRSGESHGRRHG